MANQHVKQKIKNILCFASQASQEASHAMKAFAKQYNATPISSAEDIPPEAKCTNSAIVVFGGDGSMLRAIDTFYKSRIPFYGLNYGTFGFLLNKRDSISQNPLETLNSAEETRFFRLLVKLQDTQGKEHITHATNEVSLLRMESHASKIKIKINSKTRLDALTGDGILISTPAGSTAYNFSLNGPIVPRKSNLLSLCPVSPFRPKYWRGALIDNKSTIELEVLEANARPISLTADFKNFHNIKHVTIYMDFAQPIYLLFNNSINFDEKVITEQFSVCV